MTACVWTERNRPGLTRFISLVQPVRRVFDPKDITYEDLDQAKPVFSREEGHRTTPQRTDRSYSDSAPFPGHAHLSTADEIQEQSTASLHLQADYVIPSPDIPPAPASTESSIRSHDVLPSRERADELLSLYWQLNGTMFRFLDITEIEAWYDRVWEGEDLGADRPVFLCLLNVIFSIGCIFDPSIALSGRAKAADQFHQRARALLDSRLAEHHSVLTIQCFLLSALYCQAIHELHQCCNFVGLAIRIAQDLRLDRPATSSRVRSDHRRNTLRKVWHACMFMDRAMALTFGRSPIVSSQAASAVPLPVAHPTSSTCACFASLDLALPEATAPHFFIELMKLYEILDDTSHVSHDPTFFEESNEDAAYTEYFGPRGARAIGGLLEMQSKLNAWGKQLPTHLSQASTSRRSAGHQREHLMLWLRYRHVVMSVFRPVLSAFSSKHRCDAPTTFEDTLPASLAFQCALSCVRAALDTIDHLVLVTSDVKLEDLHEILPGWGFSISYMHTAATVLVAARLQEPIIAAVTVNAIEDAWRAILKMLKRFQVFSAGAGRSASLLSSLYERVLQQCPDHLQSLQRGQKPRNELPSSHQKAQKSWIRHHSKATASPISISDSEEHSMQATQATNARATTTTVKDPGMLSVNMPPTSGWSYQDDFNDIRPLNPLMSDGPTSQGLFDMLDTQFSLGDMSWLLNTPSHS